MTGKGAAVAWSNAVSVNVHRGLVSCTRVLLSTYLPTLRAFPSWQAYSYTGSSVRVNGRPAVRSRPDDGVVHDEPVFRRIRAWPREALDQMEVFNSRASSNAEIAEAASPRLRSGCPERQSKGRIRRANLALRSLRALRAQRLVPRVTSPIHLVSRRACREAERDVFARVRATADGNHDVLLATDRVGHRRTALRSRHPDRAYLLARLFVVRAQHRPARMIRGRRHLRIAEDDERLRHHQSNAPLLTGLRDVEPAKRRMITNLVRRVAMRHLPHQVATIQIECREDAVRRLHDRQALHIESAATAARGRRTGGRWSSSFFGLHAELLQFSLARTELRRVSRGSKSRALVDAERPAGDPGHVTNVRESLRRFNESEQRDTRVRGLRVDSV